MQQRLGLLAGRAGLFALGCDQFGVGPDRLPVAPPIERKSPARQGFAGIPFALPVMEETPGCEAVAQAPDEAISQRALRRADGVRVPFVRLEIVDRDEGRLAAHGQAHVVRRHRRVDLLAQRIERLPGILGKGLGDARLFGDALDPHVEREVDVGETRHARDRRGVAIVRGRRERNVAFAGQQARGRIKADPARSGKIDLGPRVKVGEVVVRAGRPVERDKVRLELDEIARHESRRQAQMAQDLRQKPARIAARARAALECLFRALHPRLHADDVFDLARQAVIEVDHEIDGPPGRSIDPMKKGLKPRPGGLGRPVEDEIGPEVLPILEGPGFRAFLDEEIERIVDRHVGDDVDLDLQLPDQLGKHIARQPVAVGVLLVIHEMIGRCHLERMRNDPRAAVRRGPETDDLRPERDRAVVSVVCEVMDGGSDGHAVGCRIRIGSGSLSQFAAAHNHVRPAAWRGAMARRPPRHALAHCPQQFLSSTTIPFRESKPMPSSDPLSFDPHRLGQGRGPKGAARMGI